MLLTTWLFTSLALALTTVPHSTKQFLGTQNLTVVPNYIECGYDPLPFVDSCQNAWEGIPRSDVRVQFTKRRGSSSAFSLPIRWQSSSGLCIIDLDFESGVSIGSGDYARDIDLSNAVSSIITQCIASPRHVVGSSRFFGISFVCNE